MKTKLLFILFCICIFKTFSQDLIAVQNGSTPKFYEDLKLAIKEANNGDTLYLPAKNYSVLDTIRKRIHLIGAGALYNNQENMTVFSKPSRNHSQLHLDVGSSGTSIIGIIFTQSRYTGYLPTDNNITSTNDIENITIDRCVVLNGVDIYVSNSIIKNSVLGTRNNITDNKGKANLISNNIFYSLSSSFNNCEISNNVFVKMNLSSSTYTTLVGANGSKFKNNIFRPSSFSSSYSLSNTMFYRNVNISNGNINATSLGFSNFQNYVTIEDIFDIEDYHNFLSSESTFMFELPENSPYKNAGTDGTDLGIYGGRFPWKVGAAPFNPQIIFSEIPGTTDENGVLKVRIEVQAQKN